jgi:hypothetical protein
VRVDVMKQETASVQAAQVEPQPITQDGDRQPGLLGN